MCVCGEDGDVCGGEDRDVCGGEDGDVHAVRMGMCVQW